MWKPNQQIDNDRFLIQSVLGGGSYGIAYLAIDRDTGGQVVIKTLNPIAQSRADFEVIQTKFVKEAFRLAKCSHPQIVKMLNVIKHDDLWGIVMEYIDGDDLDVYLQTRGVFVEAEALDYIDQIGQAIEHIHEQGLLHRDIKPSNIVLRRETNQAVLIDFGLAREYTTDRSRSMTNAKTDGYAPIEQYERNGNFGQHTDVYALAATLYSLLTGEIPLPANFRRTGIELVAPQTHCQRNSAIEISDRVNTAILKGMALQPEDRPSTIAAFRDLLGLTNPQQNKSAAQIYYEQGYQKFQIESYSEAIDCFTQAINLDRDRANYYHNRGCAYLALAINRSSVNVSETELDDRQLLIYNCTQAIWNFTLAIGLEPFYKKYYYYRGRAYFELKYFQQSIDNFCLYSDVCQIQEKISGFHLDWDSSDFEYLSDDEFNLLSNEACEYFYIYSNIILDGDIILNEQHYFEGEQIFINILNKGCQRMPNKLVPVAIDRDSEINKRIAERNAMSQSFQENYRLLSQRNDKFQIVFLNDEQEFLYKARAYFELKQYELATSDYSKIIDTEEYDDIVHLDERWGDDELAYLGLVWDHEENGYFHESNYYRKSLKPHLLEDIRETLFECYEKIVTSYSQLGDYKSGILYCQKAIALCKRHQYLIPDWCLNKKAEMYSKLGYYHAAIEDYTSLIAINPQSGEYYISRAEASTKIETNQQFETKRLSKFLNPPDLDYPTFNYDGYEPPTVYNTFESLSDYHGYDYNDYRNEDDDLASAKARLDNYRNADAADAKYQQDFELYQQQLKLERLKLEYYQKAIEDYDRAIAIAPRNALFYIKRGSGYIELVNYAQMIDDFHDIESYQNHKEEMEKRSLEYYQKAIDDYKQAIAIDPTSTVPYGEGGDLQSKLNEYVKAINDYKGLKEFDLTFTDSYQELVTIFLLPKTQIPKSFTKIYM